MKTALGEVDLPLFVPAEDEEGFCGGLRARRHTMDQATDCVEKTVIISFYGDTDGRGEANWIFSRCGKLYIQNTFRIQCLDFIYILLQGKCFVSTICEVASMAANLVILMVIPVGLNWSLLYLQIAAKNVSWGKHWNEICAFKLKCEIRSQRSVEGSSGWSCVSVPRIMNPVWSCISHTVESTSSGTHSHDWHVSQSLRS